MIDKTLASPASLIPNSLHFFNIAYFARDCSFFLSVSMSISINFLLALFGKNRIEDSIENKKNVRNSDSGHRVHGQVEIST
jgi:hypothetical protein